MQAVFALVHLQSTLQVNNQHRGYSVLVESRDLIIPNAQQLESSGFPGLFSCTSGGAVHPASE